MQPLSLLQIPCIIFEIKYFYSLHAYRQLKSQINTEIKQLAFIPFKKIQTKLSMSTMIIHLV